MKVLPGRFSISTKAVYEYYGAITTISGFQIERGTKFGYKDSWVVRPESPKAKFFDVVHRSRFQRVFYHESA